MSSRDPQRTLARPVSVTGRGYWSGLEVEVALHPAPASSGICFVRTDLAERHRIPVCVGNRIEVPLRTVLASGTASVEMVEHLLAALAAAGIDNCEIRVNRAELPGLDGSAGPFARALEQAGSVLQSLPAPTLVVRQTIRVGDERSWVQAEPSLAGEYRCEFRVDYADDPVIGQQRYALDVTPANFARELADARTFLLAREAQWLRDQGLGRHVGHEDLLIFDERGPIGNALRFPDECARHKTLDLIGDLALAGCRLVGRFTAYRSGHRLNAEMVRRLLHEAEWREGELSEASRNASEGLPKAVRKTA